MENETDGQIACKEEIRNEYKILVEKHEGKRKTFGNGTKAYMVTQSVYVLHNNFEGIDSFHETH
jgi:hypothetical protein